jgi:hypothetical protein
VSNRENPSSGYLIEATKLAVLIPDNHRTAFNNALTDHDFEQAVQLLDQFIANGVACPSSIFTLTDTDTGDDELEEGIAYAFFDEDDLYIKQERPELIRLREKIGEGPSAHSWSIWG